MNFKNFMSKGVSEEAVTLNTGEVTKSIDFKIKKMLNIPFEIVAETNDKVKVESLLREPMVGITFKKTLENYYYGLFYDGKCYLLVFDIGFYIAREHEVKIDQDGLLTIRGQMPNEWTPIYNRSKVTGEPIPQYKEIESTLQLKHYSQLTGVKMLASGTIISNVLIDKSGDTNEQEASQIRKRLKSMFGAKSTYKFDESSNTLVLSGDWDYRTETVNLTDINNNDFVDSQRDYIYNFLGVPPQIMGSTKSSTYSNYREAMKNFLLNSAVPEMEDFVKLLNNFVFSSTAKTNVTAEVVLLPNNLPELIEEKQANFNMLSQLHQDGVISDQQLLEATGFGDLVGGGEKDEKVV